MSATNGKEWAKTHIRNGPVNTVHTSPHTLSPIGRCSWGEAHQAPP